MSVGTITGTASTDLPEDGTILDLTGGENPLTFLNMSEPDTPLALIAGMSDRDRIEGWRRAEQQFFDPPREVILDALDEQEQSVGEQRIMTDGGQCVDDIYRDDRTYDKCKWERAWGEFNAALHADRDSNAFLETVGEGVDSADKEVLDDIIGVFDEIAEKHNVETFGECWNGEVEECDDHSVDAETDHDDGLRTDGGQTTDEIILEQVGALQDESKHGAPIGDVVNAVIDETEVRFAHVFDMIVWLHDHGEVYTPARGYLRETKAVTELEADDDE